MSRPQFSIAALLLTVAAIAVVLGLMYHVPPAWACLALITLVLVFLAFITVAFLYARRSVRPFCVGAAFPLAFAFMNAANDIGLLFDDVGTALRRMGMAESRGPSGTNFLLGPSILFAIALGYLCVGFRWLIDRRPPA